jgi:L-lactate dehydrogenase complex protein LldG
MTEREKILGRIREALKVAAQMPGHGAGAAGPAAASPPATHAREWLPLVGETFEERLAAFQKNATDLKAEFHLLNGEPEIAKALVDLKENLGWKKVAAHHGSLTDHACAALGLPVCWTDSGYDAREMEACEAGISECDALVAQTGSVLLTSRSAGGRALSVLPPHHVVLARRDQLVRDLPEAFALLKRKYEGNYPSMISFITGPSRTGDIERILVLGAHGPKKLTILCI